MAYNQLRHSSEYTRYKHTNPSIVYIVPMTSDVSSIDMYKYKQKGFYDFSCHIIISTLMVNNLFIISLNSLLAPDDKCYHHDKCYLIKSSI